jgi:hypothetical protein
MEKKEIIILTDEEKEVKKKKRADAIEAEKRVYQVSLMLRRKPVSFIVQFASDKWDIGARQTRTYIRKARKEWQKYFEKLEGDGIGYHVAQMRDLKDQAYNRRKVVIGEGDEKKIITIPDLGLVFEITKEEAKLMGIYPPEKIKLDIPELIKVKVDLTE